MVKMEPYIKKWYDYLDNGKVMGLKCKRCGSFEFPPVSVCNECSGMDLEWIEMGGKGELIGFTFSQYPHPTHPTFAPYHYGTVVLEEGPAYGSMILGIEVGSEKEFIEKLPVKVHMEIQDRDGYKMPVFRIDQT